jgi:polysaccharide export outer membrane protein
MNRRQFLHSSVAAVGLAGCSALPDSGPASRDITSQASASLKETAVNTLKYVEVDLTERVISLLGDAGPGSLYRSFGRGRSGPAEITVGVGDTVQVTIFESAAGGLFIPNDAGSRPGNYVTLPSQTVDQKGFLTVPYAGLIMAKGRTLDAIQRDIVSRLASRAIEPQAVVAVTSQASSNVTVIGQVGAPSKIAINPAGDRVLDILSRAGGITDPGYEEFVTLQRKGTKATVYFLNMVTNPQENIFVQPDDTIYVYQYQRSFTAFGASGTSGQFKFQQEVLTLADAVGKAGGLLDAQADPGQILLYRIESRENLERMGVDVSSFAIDVTSIPTIFHANFRDPSSFFVAKKFFMHDRDVIYVTNADKVELFKFLGLVTGVTDAGASVMSDAVTIRNAGKSLGQQ